MKDKKTKFRQVPFISAAAGVKISAPEVEEVVAGMPFRSCSQNEIEKVKEEIKKEVDEVIIETEEQGIVIKADSLGSLEALVKLLKEKNINVKKASIGNISKKDIADASVKYVEDPLSSVILGFNVQLMPDIIAYQNVKIITHNVIYRLIEDFERWQQEEKKKLESQKLGFLIRPCKIQLMRGYLFRQSNPAIIGVDILFGTLKTNMPLMNKEGISITEVKGIQHDKENVESAEKGKQVAVSLSKVTVGRQINEGDILYSAVPEDHFRKLKGLKTYLSDEERELLKEIAAIMRETSPVWGI